MADACHPPGRDGEPATRRYALGAILPQLLEGAMLQDVDVTDLQPGLGRDLVSRPALDIPALDDVL